MDPAGLVRQYGYAALVVGTFFEGEVMLSLGGWAARSGLLKLGLVMLAGTTGTIASDQVCFWSGRLFGGWIMRRYPRLHAGVARVLRLFDRYRDGLVMGFQFVPGSCTLVPFALGLSTMSSLRFSLLDVASAALWATVFSIGGYVFGAAMQVFVHDLHRFDAWVVGGLVVLIALVTFVRHWLGRPAREAGEGETVPLQ